MISLALLHPRYSTPTHRWKFDSQSVIRIGRAPDNDIVLNSGVISRYHAELQKKDDCAWKVINLGKNGIFIKGRPVNNGVVTDGLMIQLANTGPRIQIGLEDNECHKEDAVQKRAGLQDTLSELLELLEESSYEEVVLK